MLLTLSAFSILFLFVTSLFGETYRNETPAAACTVPRSALASTQIAAQNTTHLASISRTITAQQSKVPKTKTHESLDKQIKRYSKSDEVKYSIEYALKKKKSRSQGYCYRNVKKALLAAPKGKKGLIPEYFWDEAALNAKNTLKEYGFVNLLEIEPYKTQITSPSNAPKGAVLVYSSGKPCFNGSVRDCGHIEIKTDIPGEPGYVSDYYSDDAINENASARAYGTRYKLVSVMIKP